jgi:3-oxoadipate enol-lactonase
MQAKGQNLSIQTNNLHTCYVDYGHGEIPVIFVHGFPFDKFSWNPQIDYLKDSYRVIAYDIRGFCKSTTDDIKASIGLFAEDLIGLMDALHIPKAVVCGLSMGGYIVLNAVQHYPDRFDAIVLCDTQCVADTAEGKEKRYQAIQQIENNGLHQFAESFLEKIFSASTLKDKKEIVDKIRNTILGTPIPTMARTLNALAQRLETASILETIKVPTLILCGAEDAVTPPKQSKYLHDHISGSKYYEIPGAGHMSNLEQADIFNGHLKQFLDDIS